MRYNTLKLAQIVIFLMQSSMSTLEDNILYNVALYKPAFQSTVFSVRRAENGNNGIKSEWMDIVQCSQTLNRNNSWWMVDLLDMYLIKSIILTNR